MSEIPAFPYDLIWGERVIRSVANLTRQDGIEFMQLAAMVPLDITVETMPLAQANEALDRLRNERLRGLWFFLRKRLGLCECKRSR